LTESPVRMLAGRAMDVIWMLTGCHVGVDSSLYSWMLFGFSLNAS
jgi:hypothetical protein